MFIIYGPTAVGKTDFALNIAQKVPAEIVNLDMGQFYTALSIGTAKPDWRSMPVPHHLFDVVDEARNFTVAEYRAKLFTTLHDIWQRGNLPILVGGSGFYLKSIFYPPVSPIPIDHSRYDTLPVDQAWRMLHEVDPDRAAAINPNDAYRIKRALAIWHATGQKPSEQAPIYEPPCPFLLVSLLRERHELYAKIDARVHEMLRAGWVEEVTALRGTPWEQFLRSKKIIGYDDLLHYLDGEHSEQALKLVVHTIQQKTRNYAKRQLTFWRMLDRTLQKALQAEGIHAIPPSEIVSINLTLFDVDLYIEQLSDRLMTLFE